MFRKTRSKWAAFRYNHPSHSVRLILVAGEYGASTTALYISDILTESGQSSSVFTPIKSHINAEIYLPKYDNSADSIQRAIAKAKKRSQNVVMVVTPAFIRACSLETLQIDAIVATSGGETTQSLLDATSSYVVLRDSIAADDLAIAPHQRITFGESEKAEARLTKTKLYRNGTEVQVTIDHQTKLLLSTYLLGKTNALNVTAAVATGYLLGLDISSFEEAIARLEHVRGNLEKCQTSQPYSTYIDNAPTVYSADLVSDSVKQLTKRRLLIACDESFDNDTLDILSQRADHVTVAAGEEINGRYHADDIRQATELTLRSAKIDDTVLLLGPKFGEVIGDISYGQMLVNEILEK